MEKGKSDDLQYPIRVAYIIGKMLAGGVETVVFNYYRAIDHNKYQFDFYYDEDSTVEPPQDILEMGARFIKLPPYQRLSRYIKELRQQLREEKYLIVHSHLNTLSVFPLFAAWREKVPIRIAHNHSVPAGNELKRNFMKNVLRLFSKTFSTDYFACSEKAGRWLFGDKMYESGKVYLMKNAVQLDKFRLDDGKALLNNKLELDNRFVVGHVGRFTYAKNHKFLLDIFCEILKLKNNAVLVLVGDGELHDEIVEEIKKHNLDGKVVMIGNVCNPECYYSLFNVVILPSVFEGLSMTTIESQCAGIPIVISKTVPQEAIISDGCAYMDIGDTPINWAKKAIGISKKKVTYTNAIDDYDIMKQAPLLANKYDDMLRKIV